MKRNRERTQLKIEEAAETDFELAADFDSSVKIQEPQRAADVAQALIYQNRLPEATDVLEPFGETFERDLALRDAGELGLARAELSYWKGQYHEASRFGESSAGIFRLLGDRFGEGRALYMLGRILRRQGNFESAMQELEQAREALSSSAASKTRFYLGCIEYNIGVIHQQLGALDRAEDHLTRALTELSATERGRFYGIALNSYGVLQKSKGQYAEATRTFQKAISLLSAHASFDDLAHAINNLANVQILTGELEQAEKNLLESLELRRRAGDIAGEAGTLELLGRLHLERGNFVEAEKSFKSSMEMAELAHNDHERALALVGMGRLLNRTGRPADAKGCLEDARRVAIQLNSKMLEALSAAYLAESAALAGSGTEAQKYLSRARELAAGYDDQHLQREINRLDQAIRGEKIRLAEGTFTIRSAFMPTWREAHDALGRFMLSEALKEAGGSQVGAARILGVTKAYVTMLRRKHSI